MKKNLPLVLVILDGWGIAPGSKGNAISQANTPIYSRLLEKYPSTALEASGQYVGLPPGQIGNSEAGHMNIGSGRVITQDSVKILTEIDNRTFYDNPALIKAAKRSNKNESIVHLMGILSSDQCPHMHPRHLLAVIDLLVKQKVKDIVLHLFTDGRDSLPKSALDHWEVIVHSLPDNVRVGSVCGRFYLDRKKKWERTKVVYDLLTLGKAKFTASSFEEAIKMAYERDETDEYVSPTVIKKVKQAKPVVIEDDDSIIFFNLRSDRARQLTMAFVVGNFDGFKRTKVLPNILFVALTDFGPMNIATAFKSDDISSTLPMGLASLRQLYMAETEKYAHITYFLNGGYDAPVAGEQRILVKSPDVRSYDSTPAMSTADITKILVKSLESDLYDVFVVNFAGPDMVGHTGNLKATIQACEAVDVFLGDIYKTIIKNGGTLLVTADHGNAESMIDELGGGPDTSHTKNKVPFILASTNSDLRSAQLRNDLSLSSIGSTILELLDLPVPTEMTSFSLLKI